MAKQVQLRRGTLVQNNTFTGAPGELVAVTDQNKIALHDGTTVGGHLVATETYVNDAIATINPVGVNEYTKTEVDGLLAEKADNASLSLVATSGDYSDLLNVPSFANVASSGDYNDLTNKPLIPDLTGYATETYVNDAIATINPVGVNEYTKTEVDGLLAEKANNSAIPTANSQLTNDNGFITGITWSEVTNKPAFANVATSGNYSDLLGKPALFSGDYTDLNNKPSIPTLTSQLGNDAGFLNAVEWNIINNKPTFANVATSGSYLDLTNTPAQYLLPTATDTILGGVKVGAGLTIINGVLSSAASTGNVTFSGGTISTLGVNESMVISPAGELLVSTNVGIHNSNPGRCLDVGNISEYAHTGEIGFMFNDGSGYDGTASIGWAWENTTGEGNDITGGQHALFGIFKAGSPTSGWITIDKNAPTGLLEFNSSGAANFDRPVTVNGPIESTTSGFIFPDASVQTKAFNGDFSELTNVPVTIPTVPPPVTSKGASGDMKSDVAIDTGYFYYCTEDYTDGVNDIWRRIANDGQTW